jgi:hypothetical protein
VDTQGGGGVILLWRTTVSFGHGGRRRLASGRERTAAHMQQLFASAGLSLVERVPLATGFSAFRLRAYH